MVETTGIEFIENIAKHLQISRNNRKYVALLLNIFIKNCVQNVRQTKTVRKTYAQKNMQQRATSQGVGLQKAVEPLCLHHIFR